MTILPTSSKIIQEARRLAGSKVCLSAHVLAWLMSESKNASWPIVNTGLNGIRQLLELGPEGSGHCAFSTDQLEEWLDGKSPSWATLEDVILALIEVGRIVNDQPEGKGGPAAIPTGRVHAFDGSIGSAYKVLRSLRFSETLSRKTSIPELGLGRWYQAPAVALLGKQRLRELEKYSVVFLKCVKGGRPLLVVGDRRIGKTLFLEHMIQDFTLSDTAKPRFAWFPATDFLQQGILAEEIFSKLAQFLEERPSVIPVFDDMQEIQSQPFLVTAFERNLGAICSRRASLFVATAASARGAAIPVRNLESIRLITSDAETAAAVARSELDRMLKAHQVVKRVEGDTELFLALLLATAHDRYPGSPSPHREIELLVGAFFQAEASLRRVARDSPLLTTQDLLDYVAMDLSLSPETLGKDKRGFYSDLEEKLNADVFGQEHVVRRVCEVLYSRSVSPARDWPRGRFIFTGPPGTGKTHMGRSLAIRLGYGADAFHEFKMGEFSGDGARNRFIGADPGYRDSGETKTIFDAIGLTPACVILLDEIDRASGAIQDILLGMLEGKGTDAFGNDFRFDQAIFILTTNQGQEQVEGEYQKMIDRGLERNQIVRGYFANEADDGFTEASFRKLLINRSLSPEEDRMRAWLADQMTELGGVFMKSGEEAGTDRLRTIARYAKMKLLHSQLHYDNQKSALDRALLDRVDFLFPFFPLQEPHLRKLLKLHLEREGWSTCSVEEQNDIVAHAMKERERGRAIIREVERKKSGDSHFRLFGETSPPV